MEEKDKSKVDFKALSPRSIKILIVNIDFDLKIFLDKHKNAEEKKKRFLER